MEQFEKLHHTSRLIAGYLKENLNPKEKQELENWLGASSENLAQFERLTAESKLENDYLLYGNTDKVKAWVRIVNATGYRKPRRKIVSSWRIAAAASVLLFLSASVYFILNKDQGQLRSTQYKNDIAPGSNQAVLIAGGKSYQMNGVKNGLITKRGGATISKSANGQLIYTGAAGGGKLNIVYDTLMIPRGAQYRLKLADGTIVYLNAETKLRFPEVFAASERRIELISGEAYFEVVHNDKVPFRVITKSQLIEDIGTHFNINAYDDEAVIKTTLIEGSIALKKSTDNILLKPGQQAISSPNKVKVVDQVNVDEICAWKQGKFLFNNTPLETIMKQVSRWYDVQVVYLDDDLKQKTFFAMSTRFAKVSQLLNYLEETGNVKFMIQGRKITVSKK